MRSHMGWDFGVGGQAIDPLHALRAALVQERRAALVVAVIAVEGHLERDLLTHHLIDFGHTLVPRTLR